VRAVNVHREADRDGFCNGPRDHDSGVLYSGASEARTPLHHHGTKLILTLQYNRALHVRGLEAEVPLFEWELRPTRKRLSATLSAEENVR